MPHITRVIVELETDTVPTYADRTVIESAIHYRMNFKRPSPWIETTSIRALTEDERIDMDQRLRQRTKGRGPKI